MAIKTDLFEILPKCLTDIKTIGEIKAFITFLNAECHCFVFCNRKYEESIIAIKQF